MRVELGELARRGLELHVGRDLQAGVRTALADFLATAANGGVRVEAPRFEAEREQGRVLPLEIAVDAVAEAALEAEARRQGISVSRLASHSVYLYLARLDLSYR